MDTRTVPIKLYEARPDIQPRAVHGWFAAWRWALVFATQAFFYGMPWLQWNGRQALLFDIEAQRFFVFGLVLYPQDLIYLAALLVISALLLFFVTAVAGRVWCGYACPQTVYTEIFMWIEHRFEGDRTARLRLHQGPWNANRVLRQGGKHAAWLALSLWTGFTFVGYFTPIRQLAGQMGPWHAFWILFYAGATYGNAGWMREQVCKYMCPYARFQSALIDGDSLVIAYDKVRGEPRGAKSKKSAAAGTGDCVDCTLCVQVCPTGIDIRNGLQNECIGCAACIDACDDVMDKVGSPRGLIRYDTGNAVANGWTRATTWRRVCRPRTLLYGGALLVAGTAFAVSIANRSPFLFDVIKDRGAMARFADDGAVENVYRLQVMNRSEQPQRLRISADGAPGLVLTARELLVPPAGIESAVVTLRLPAEAAGPLQGRPPLPVRFTLAGAGAVRHEASTFLVPR